METACEKLSELLQNGSDIPSLKLVIGNLIQLFATQSKAQDILEEKVILKADASDIANIFQNVSNELYHNVEALSPIKKRSSAKFEGPGQENVKLKQSLANFGEGVEILSAGLLRLNQARIDFEKRMTAIESVKSEWITKRGMAEKLASTKEELVKSVHKGIQETKESVDELEGKLGRMEHEFGEKMNVIESQAMWRLKDCQNLMKSRISEDYLESRLKLFVDIQQSAFNEFQKKIDEGKEKIKVEAKESVERLRVKVKEKNQAFKNSIKALEQSVAQKLPLEKLAEHKQETEDFMASLSKDISAFNRLIHSFEEKLASMHKSLEDLKKVKNIPAIAFKVKEESDGKDSAELLEYIEKVKLELREQIKQEEKVIHERLVATITGAQVSNLEEVVSEKINELVGGVIGKVEAIPTLEARFKKYIMDIDERVIKLRNEINPHEFLKSVKGKADTAVVDKVVSDNTRIQSYIQAFKADVENNICTIHKVLKEIAPVFNEIRNTVQETAAARQSNCLVCGRKTPSPDFERRAHANFSVDDGALSRLQYLGRNRGLVNNESLTEEGTMVQPMKVAKSKSFVQNAKHQATQSVACETDAKIIVRKAKGSRCSTAIGYGQNNKRKYNLPLSYQIMNERHKEGSIGSMQNAVGFK